MSNLTSRLGMQVYHGIEMWRHAEEEIDHSVGLTVVPDQTPGQFAPVMVIVITWRSGPEADSHYFTHLSFDFLMSDGEVNDLVSKALRDLRQSTGSISSV
jgi:hypothetical protein